MTFETWLACAAASLIAVIIPGPVVVFVLGRALGVGWRADAMRRPPLRRGFNRPGGSMLVGAGLATAAMRRA